MYFSFNKFFVSYTFLSIQIKQTIQGVNKVIHNYVNH